MFKVVFGLVALLAVVFLVGTVAVNLLREIPDAAQEPRRIATSTINEEPVVSSQAWVHVVALSGGAAFGSRHDKAAQAQGVAVQTQGADRKAHEGVL